MDLIRRLLNLCIVHDWKPWEQYQEVRCYEDDMETKFVEERQKRYCRKCNFKQDRVVN